MSDLEMGASKSPRTNGSDAGASNIVSEQILRIRSQVMYSWSPYYTARMPDCVQRERKRGRAKIREHPGTSEQPSLGEAPVAFPGTVGGREASWK